MVFAVGEINEGAKSLSQLALFFWSKNACGDFVFNALKWNAVNVRRIMGSIVIWNKDIGKKGDWRYTATPIRI